MTKAGIATTRVARFLLGLALLAAAPAWGQGQKAAAARQSALERFAPWVGNWSGSGWSLDRTGRRTEFDLVETVAWKVGGTVLLIEGHGTARGDSAFTTHDGLVVLSYEEHSARYRWNGHELDSGTIDTEVIPMEGGLTWSIPAGPGVARLRFMILFEASRWQEVGEFSADGASWTKFMEAKLQRSPAP